MHVELQLLCLDSVIDTLYVHPHVFKCSINIACIQFEPILNQQVITIIAIFF